MSLDIEKIRQRLSQSEGPAFWRSLEELAGTTEFRETLEREFPLLAGEWTDSLSRRAMLRLMGASVAMLGLTGCFHKEPQGTLVPYTAAPDEIIPGKPIYFASAMPLDGYGKGVLAVSREGRPIKIEGNPDHPASLGASDIHMQASILDLYDPDRSRNVRRAGEIARWDDFCRSMRMQFDEGDRGGEGVRLLTGAITSPTLIAQLTEFLKRYSGAAWHQFDPLASSGNDPFAEPVEVLYDLSGARTIVSIGSDFMYRGPASLRYARQFTDGRRVRDGHREMNRLYAIDSIMRVTASMADNYLCVVPSRIESLVRVLAAQLGIAVAGVALSPQEQKWIELLAAELRSAEPGTSVLIAGDAQSVAVRAIAHQINQTLGNVGKTVRYLPPVARTGHRSLKELAQDMRAGRVRTLLMMGGNPAYTSPVDIDFASALEAMSQLNSGDGGRRNFTAHLATHYDETSFRCQWHVPRAHWLESWGDVSAFDGTVSIIQPLIAPLYGGKSEWELMEALLDRPYRQGIEIVQGHWSVALGHAANGSDFQSWWVSVLQKGVVPNSASTPRAQPPPLRAAVASQPASAPTDGLEIIFDPDPNVRDGEFANNAWLQELPRPFTKLTWDNAALISVATAQSLGGVNGALRDGDMIRIRHRQHEIDAPVMLLPGQADGVITLHLGYGRTRGGQVMLQDGPPEGNTGLNRHGAAAPRGYNAYRLRTSDAPWFASGAQANPLNRAMLLAITRNHHAMSTNPQLPGIAPWLKPEVIATPGESELDLATHNRKIIRTATFDHFKQHPDFVKDLDPAESKRALSLYKPWDYQQGLQWGMVIDQTACIGCNACVLACQAENNIPVVGKQEVGRQREMHWIRIDDYFSGPLDSPTIFHQPVPCMHCEDAPCEYVCPVGATTHSDEGINEMTYNRCIGTRYCSNNCPYKVRRFNFFLYADYTSANASLLHNPDVTVRSRGVMEKCNYCIQRIDRSRVQLEKEVLELREQARRAETEAERQRLNQEAESRGRQIVRSLETACQQACPTKAIVFGDTRDAGGEVAALKRHPTNYGLLTELSTKPRTTYLARLTNPNPSLAAGTQPGDRTR